MSSAAHHYLQDSQHKIQVQKLNTRKLKNVVFHFSFQEWEKRRVVGRKRWEGNSGKGKRWDNGYGHGGFMRLQQSVSGFNVKSMYGFGTRALNLAGCHPSP